MVDKNFNDAFFNCTIKSGCCAKKTGNAMSSTHWNAMSDAISLLFNQQRIVKKFIAFHCAHRIVESDYERSKFIEKFVPCATFQFSTLDGKYVIVWNRSLKDCLSFFMNNYEYYELKDAKHIEVCFVGDNGKDTWIFLAIALIRHNNDNK